MPYDVSITTHAILRWQQRVSPCCDVKSVKKWVRRKLISEMSKGMDSDSQGTFPLELCPGLVAKMAPTEFGGWAVVTFITTAAPESLQLPG